MRERVRPQRRWCCWSWDARAARRRPPPPPPAPPPARRRPARRAPGPGSGRAASGSGRAASPAGPRAGARGPARPPPAPGPGRDGGGAAVMLSKGHQKSKDFSNKTSQWVGVVNATHILQCATAHDCIGYSSLVIRLVWPRRPRPGPPASQTCQADVTDMGWQAQAGAAAASGSLRRRHDFMNENRCVIDGVGRWLV